MNLCNLFTDTLWAINIKEKPDSTCDLERNEIHMLLQIKYMPRYSYRLQENWTDSKDLVMTAEMTGEHITLL